MDKRIFDEMKVGKEIAYESFVKEYNGLVFAYAYSILENKDLAEEVRQKVFIKVASKIGQVRDVAKFDAWLYRMTYRICMDEVRSGSYKNEITTDIEDLFLNLEQSPDSEINEVWMLLKQMPKNKQTILLGKYVFDFSEDELATAMKIPLGTLKSRLFRAKNEFKDVLIQNNLGRVNFALVGPGVFATLKAMTQTTPATVSSTAGTMVNAFSQHTKNVLAAKVITGVVGASAIGIGIYFMMRPVEVIPEVVVEPCKIEDVVFDDGFTNKDIKLHVNLTCDKGEKITVNGEETTSIDGNGDYKIEVYQDGKVSDTRMIHINAIDKVEPYVVGDYFDENDFYYIKFHDDGSGVGNVQLLVNGYQSNDFTFNEDTSTLSFKYVDGTEYVVIVKDKADNSIKLSIE